jgi:hypothetical protein
MVLSFGNPRLGRPQRIRLKLPGLEKERVALSTDAGLLISLFPERLMPMRP